MYKVILSAYACQPHKGSEPSLGWNTATEMAKRHKVWVLTREENRAAIEAELALHPVHNLHVIYHDLSERMRRPIPIGPDWRQLDNKLSSECSYYLWQIGAYQKALNLHHEVQFDLAHHISYSRCWSPSFVSLLPVPFIWGPVAGGETVPPGLRSGLSWRGRAMEATKEVAFGLSMRDPFVRTTAQNSTIVLADSQGVANRVKSLGARHVRIHGASGVDKAALGSDFDLPPATTDRPFRFVSMTRLLHWKGIHLGLKAFARLADRDATYWILGEGPELGNLRRLARDLGIADRVSFRTNRSRREWLDTLRAADMLVHPCLCNSGSMISLEAMAAGRPVLCLNLGAIQQQVTDETGFVVDARTTPQTVAELNKVMHLALHNRELVHRKGQAARKRVLRHFTWPVKAEFMDGIYNDAVEMAYTGRQQERLSSVA